MCCKIKMNIVTFKVKSGEQRGGEDVELKRFTQPDTKCSNLLFEARSFSLHLYLALFFYRKVLFKRRNPDLFWNITKTTPPSLFLAENNHYMGSTFANRTYFSSSALFSWCFFLVFLCRSLCFFYSPPVVSKLQLIILDTTVTIAILLYWLWCSCSCSCSGGSILAIPGYFLKVRCSQDALSKNPFPSCSALGIKYSHICSCDRNCDKEPDWCRHVQ